MNGFFNHNNLNKMTLYVNPLQTLIYIFSAEINKSKLWFRSTGIREQTSSKRTRYSAILPEKGSAFMRGMSSGMPHKGCERKEKYLKIA